MCFGDSVSLGLKSKEDDSFMATAQVFGFDAAFELNKWDNKK